MSKQIAFVGVDPGVRGAFCLLIPQTKQIMFKETTLTALELYEWFRAIDNQFNLGVCMIEKVHAIPGSGAKATFAFGRNFERVNIIPELAEVSVDQVTPQTWQKFVGLSIPTHLKGSVNASKRKTHIKKTIAEIALRLYPKAELKGIKGGLLDGRSDALMIAHYAARTFNLQ